ncbi:MAG: hypothetical protein QM736_16685 [Vicinamibacterales bacterium]
MAELNQLFNAIDPAPFRQRDLDPDAEEFIVSWAREVAADRPLALVVRVDRPAGLPDEAAILRDAIRDFFVGRAQVSRRRLRQLFRRGRTSLMIGILFLTGSLLLGDIVSRLLNERGVGEILRESLVIGGWVAMWRPMEIFLYDWWPIQADVRLAERLSAMPVSLSYEAASGSDTWRSDWPAATAPVKSLATEERRSQSEPALPSSSDDVGASARHRRIRSVKTHLRRRMCQESTRPSGSHLRARSNT